MILSFFGLILFGLLVVAVGLAALKLLALLVNAMVGQIDSQQSANLNPRSGLKSAFLVALSVFCVLSLVAALRYFRMQSSLSVSDSKVQVDQEDQADRQDSQSSAAQFASAERKDAVKKALAELIEKTNAQDAIIPSKSTAEEKRPTVAVSADEASAIDQAALLEARRAQLRQLVASIGQFVSSSLELVTDKQAATIFGQAAESANGDIVVFQPSEEMVQQILGTAGQDLLKSFNSELPDRIRQTYALIPLTPPVGSTVPVKPLLAASGLEKIANSIVSIVERAESATTVVKAEVGSDVFETERRVIPDWVNQTDGRRIVAHTKPILPGDDSDQALTIAINEALAKHVDAVTATMDPDMHEKAQYVRMELPQAVARNYVVETFERLETMQTATEGAKPFRVLYALLEFPEAVDQMAVRHIRTSIQQDRIMGLGGVIGFAWLSICSTGIGIRQWRKGTRLRRITAVPVFAVIAVPALLLTAATLVTLANGNTASHFRNPQPVTVILDHM